jgi:hypothetical protein
MHRCGYDYVRANKQGRPGDFDMSRYDLTEEEQATFDARTSPRSTS